MDELGELLADMTDADRVTVNAAWFRKLRNAEKAVERVRALHARIDLPGRGQPVCSECWDEGVEDYSLYPCPTIQALERNPS